MLNPDHPPRYVESVNATSPTTALYSDVVARRPPSPRKVTTASLAHSAVTSHSERELSALVDNPTDKIVESTTSDKYDPPREEEMGAPWNTVQRRHAHSLSSLNDTQRTGQDIKWVTNVLTAGQAMTIQAATEKLTSQQKETFQHQQKRVPQAAKRLHIL
jgi:hypothetical protein